MEEERRGEGKEDERRVNEEIERWQNSEEGRGGEERWEEVGRKDR